MISIIIIAQCDDLILNNFTLKSIPPAAIVLSVQSRVKSSFRLRRRPLLALCGQAFELCPDWPQ
ncbi:hypothetical protein NEI59_24250, partial [Klebsiella pneumoniae]|uniref:hypothetical protein n=1 Tax=Klebsiella pneumoniae TaxID=573 RepID=UPI0020D15BBC